MSTKPSQEQLATAFHEIITKLPRAKRKELSPQIEVFKSFFGITKDIVNLDRRSLIWAEGSSTRKSVEENRNYELIIRGVEPIKCNITEAAKYLGKSVQSVRVLMGRGLGKWSGQVKADHGEVDFVQLYKLDDEGKRIFQEVKSEKPKSKFQLPTGSTSY